MSMSLYIHIPFCRKKCVYCDFYSVKYDRNLVCAYVDVLCRQIEVLDDNFSTVFIGGGTPTVLDVRLLKKILIKLHRVSKDVSEFTIEVNPESFTREKADLLISEGVNRISIGGQSLYDKKLRRLGRVHSVNDVDRAVTIAVSAGFKNINLDLIFGVWGQNLDMWKKELNRAVRYPITHISVYALTIETNTPLDIAVKRKQIIPLSEDITANMYGVAMEYLKKKGFYQYEVSNYSKKGYECKHNLSYWNYNEYIGLGPSAVSFKGGVREKNVNNLENYIKNLGNKKGVVDSTESLSPVALAKEFAAIKIRTKDGINFGDFRERFGLDFLTLESEALTELYREKLLKYRMKNKVKIGLYLTKRGFLFCDTVSSSFV